MACHGTMEYNLVDAKDYTKDYKVVVKGHTDYCNAMTNNHIGTLNIFCTRCRKKTKGQIIHVEIGEDE